MASTIALAMSGPMPGTVISCRQTPAPVCQLFDLLGNALDALIETPPIARRSSMIPIIRGDNTSVRLARISGKLRRKEVLGGLQCRAPRGSYGFD